jgi:ubiquinone/menaquinone biosynthesis C-methylase UbiE
MNNHVVQDPLEAEIHRYYEQAFDDKHPLYHQLHPTTGYADDSLWAYYRARLQQIIVKYNLRDARVLEVGCGVGFLQDMVEDYTGIDLAKNSGKFVHKAFVNGSVTTLPFSDNTFDAVWSVFVLEHIPDPEAMLREVRRVTKPTGLFFLCAAWNVPAWVAPGYDIRPFKDLDWWGSLRKCTVLPRNTKVYRLSVTLLQRIGRQILHWFVPSPPHLRFRALTPNFEAYWSSDADACTAIDSHAVWLWMTAHGDECIGVRGLLKSLLVRHSEPLLFRVKPIVEGRDQQNKP